MKFPEFNFSEGFLLAVQMGRVPGVMSYTQSGQVSSLGSGDINTDIWDKPLAYSWEDVGVDSIKYLVSSSVTDKQPIQIFGLDIDGDLVKQTVTLNGQVPVLLSTPLWRIYKMQNRAMYYAPANNNTGSIYCTTSNIVTAGVPTDTNIRVMIEPGNNKTLMALYTIPRGYVGFLYKGMTGLSFEGNLSGITETLHIHFETRKYKENFINQIPINLNVGGSSIYIDKRELMDIIPAMTDIRVRCKYASANGMGVVAQFSLLMFDENMFPSDYLQAIEQPGY